MAHSPPHSTNLETGVNGANVDPADAGSPDHFDAVSGIPPVYTNVQKHSGNLSMRWSSLTTVQLVQWTGLGSITGDYYVRFYLFLPSLPPDNNCYPINVRTSADANCALLRILSTGIIQGRDASNSSAGIDGTVAVATNQWVRIEWRVRAGTGGTGLMTWQLFNSADSTTVTDSGSATGLTLGANIDRVSFGLLVTAPAAGMTIYFDDLADGTTGWLGPVTSSSTAKTGMMLGVG